MMAWAVHAYKIPSIRFLIVGGTNFFVTYAVYLAVLLVLNYAMAFSISFVAGLIFTSVLTIRHTFAAQLTMARVAVYGAYYLLYFAANFGLIKMLVEGYDMDVKWAPLLSLAALTPVHFLLSKALVGRFRRFGRSQTD
jgi:putative flippase GtrA